MEDTDADLSGCSDADDNNEDDDDSASPAPQPRSNARRPPNDTEGPGPEAAAEPEPEAAAAPPSPPPSSKDPAPSTNDRNVRKAVRFLSSPSVVPLGDDVKANFLRERGMTDVEIERAVDVARWREQRKQRHRGRGRRGGRDGRRRRANSTNSSSSTRRTRTTRRRRRRRGSSEDSEDSIWNEKEDSAISSPGGDWDDDSAEEEEVGEMVELSGRRRKGRRQQHQLDQQPMTSDDPFQPQQLQHQYHQLQHQYAQPPPSAVVAALPLAVGGLLGASAAAFLRWIDGGEFGPGPGFGLGSGGSGGGGNRSSGSSGSSGSQSDQRRDRRAFPAGGRGQADDGTDNSAEKGGGAEKAAPDRDLDLQVDGTHDETRESSIYDYLDEYLGDEDGRQHQHQDDDGEEYQEKYYEEEEEEDYYEGEEDYYEGEEGAMEEYYEEELGQQHEEEEEEPTASDRQQQLSRQIQDLTATVQRFAEAQERTVRQKTHEDGRDMTDSAMNLLRGSSSSAAAAANRQTNNEPLAVPNVALAVMLTEMKCEVQSAREAMDSAAAAATGDRRGSSAEAVRRATNKVDAVSASLLRLQKLLLGDHRTIGGGGGGGGGDEDELNLPVARNVASMYETPSRMFSTGELSPVRGCGMDGDGAGTTIDVTFSDDGGLGGGGGGGNGNGNGSGSANVSFEFEPTIIKTEEKKQDDCDCDYEYDEHNAEATEYPTVGKEALARAIGLLSDPKVNGEEVIVKSCAQLLYLYVTNLSSNASVKRYRKIYTTNANFRNNVRGCRGGVEVLQSLGFVDKGSFMEWNGNMEDEEAGLVLFNEAAARLSVLKVMGNRAELTDSSEEMESFAPMNNMATPRYRSATPPPPGAPPRPAITSSTSTGSAASISNNPQLLTSPSGFVTPRMRGDGNDRFLSSPGANSVSSANLLCSPPVIDKHPSDQDGAAAVFGSGQDNDQGLGFPSAPSHSSVTSSAAAAAAEIFRSNKILPPRAPANASKDGENRNATSDYESIFGLHGSAFKRASSNQSCQSEPALLESGSNVKLKLRRSVASEDDAEFAARRNSKPSVGAATEVARNKPRSDSHDKESAMYFNLADMVGRGTESARPDTPGTPGSDRSNVSPSTLDYTLSPLNTSLLSVRTDATDA